MFTRAIGGDVLRRHLIIAIVAHGALSACIACAGWAPGELPARDATSTQAAGTPQRAAADAATTAAEWARTLSPAPASPDWLASTRPAPIADFAAPVPPSDNAETIQQLPPAPSSLALGLTALAGLGLYQAGRKVHWSRLPDWYHTGGPQQIGHATPLDLDRVPLPVCVFETPTPHVAPILRFALEAVVPIPQAFTPLARAPRAPPLFSSDC